MSTFLATMFVFLLSALSTGLFVIYGSPISAGAAVYLFGLGIIATKMIE